MCIKLWGFALVLFLFSTPALGSSGSYSFTYQAYVTDNSNVAQPNLSAITLKFQIYDPSASCLLYEEQQSGLSTDGSAMVSVRVGSPVGDAARTVNDPGLNMSTIFVNGSVVRSAGTNCATGYTSAVGDARLLRVTMNGTALTPDTVLNSVPRALVAETLEGKGPNQFIQVDPSVTQSNMDTLTNGSDASALHNHNSLYARLGASNNFGANSLYTSGQVGIGTTTPGGDLDIEKSAPALRIGSTTNSGNVTRLDFYGNNGASNTASIQSKDNSNVLSFYTGGTQALQIDTSQNAFFSKSLSVAGVIGLGKYDSSTEPALITALTGLGTSAMGTMWEYSTTSGVAPGKLRYWDGSAAQDVGSGGSLPFVKTDGSTPLTADWSVGGHKLTNVTDPTAAQDAATKNYVDTSSVNANYVAKTGSTMTGALILPNGGTAFPSLAVGSSTNGLFSPGANMLGVAIGGVEALRIDNNRRIGVGLTAPTAYLHLPASTAVANTAPLKFNAGVLLGTPEPGAMEYDGTNLYYTDSITRRTLATTTNLTSYLLKGGDTMTGALNNTAAGTAINVTNDINVGGAYRIGTSRILSNAGTNNIFVGINTGNSLSTGSGDAFFGANAGSAVTSGYNNTFVGNSAGASTNTGFANTFTGNTAGLFNTVGNNNTFTGSTTGFSNTSGNQNTFVGSSAGYNNSSGGNNTFLGQNSGQANTTGGNNTFVGQAAGYSNNAVGAVANTFVGQNSGFSNTTGYSNAFFGQNSGQANSSGYYNTFLGQGAGQANTTSANNTFTGYYAGYFSTGASNTMTGSYAGYSVTVGAQNVITGYNAAQTLQSGSANVVIGTNADVNTLTDSQATAIGTQGKAGPSGTSVGTWAWATGTNSAALGYNSYATATDAIAIGDTATASATGAIQLGLGTNSTPNSLQVGSHLLMDGPGNVHGVNIGIYIGSTAINTFTGNLGGYAGAKTKCNVDYPGSHMCTGMEMVMSAQQGIAMPSNYAWYSTASGTGGGGNPSDCAGWTSSGTDYGMGWYSLAGGGYSYACNTTGPVACCK